MASAEVVAPPVDVEAGLAAGESTPLLASSADEPPPLQDIKAESLKEKTVSGVAAVNFVMSVLTLVFHSALNPIVFLSGFLGLLISPLAAMQQHKLTQVEALAQTNERLQSEVDDLAAQNQRLASNLQQTEESVYNLQAMQQTLETLQAVQGQSMDELEGQLEESKTILSTMHKNYKGQVLQNLISVLLGADEDGNMILSDDDIADIIHRLENLHNVNINDEALKQMIIENGRSIEAVMAVAKQALMADSEEGQSMLFSFLHDEEEEEE